MENPHEWTSLSVDGRHGRILEQLKRNDEVFRNTMESIFQKYSNLDDPGLDVCLKTMTYQTGKGSVPMESKEAERALQQMRNRVNVDRRVQGLDSSRNKQYLSEHDMDVTQRAASIPDHSRHINDSLWHNTDSSLNSVNESHSSWWGETSQPEEEDEDLEKTLSSHGGTLLDVYPSMLNQIGEAYRRQQVTDAASAVLRKYRRNRWQSSQAQRRNSSLSNNHDQTLNKTTDSPVSAHKLLNRNISSHHKNGFHWQEASPSRSKRENSPLMSIRKSSPASSACFYSPRGENSEKSVAEPRTHWRGLQSQHQHVCVLELSTPQSSPSTSSGSLSPDLNQTYNVESVPVPRSAGVLTSTVSSPTRSVCNSPYKVIKSSPLTGRGSVVTTSPSHHHRSHLGQQHTTALVGKESLKYRFDSPALFSQKAVTGSPSTGGRSPLKARVHIPEQEQEAPLSFSYSKHLLPRKNMDISKVYKSPSRGQQYMLSSPRNSHHSFSECRENVATAEVRQVRPRPPERLRSLSGPQPTLLSNSQMSSRHIDAEFRRLYHHFICRGTSSSYPTSSCHVCENRMDKSLESSGFSSSSMSALALTPLQSKLRKRRRQSEIEESLRFKRFRESCSPVHTQNALLLQRQRSDRDMTRAVAASSEDKRTWNRAVLLQCPSPGFLSASGYIKKVSDHRPGLQISQPSPSRRNASVWTGAVEATSPVRPWNRGGVLLSPSGSRRRLLYGPVQ